MSIYQRRNFLLSSTAVAKIEYIVLLGALVIGTPALVSVVVPLLEDKTCEASSVIDINSDCLVSTLSAQDKTTTIWEGDSYTVDLVDGSNETIELQEGASLPLSLRYGVAYAQGLGQGQGPGQGQGNQGGNGQGLPIQGLVPGDPPGRGRSYIRIDENRRPQIDPDLLRGREISVKEISPIRGRSGSAPGGRLQKLDHRTARFETLTDFNALRSGQSRTIEFDYTLQGRRDADTANATVAVTVLGFDVQPDEITLWEQQTGTVDLFANDHDIPNAPGNRSQISIANVSGQTEGLTIESSADGLVRYSPPSSLDGLRSGQSETRTITYTVQGPSPSIALDQRTTNLTVIVKGFSADNDMASVYDDGQVTIPVLSNDVSGLSPSDAGTATIRIVSGPSRGSAFVSGNQIVYRPGPRPAGVPDGARQTVSFTYEATVGGVARDTATVSVTVLSYIHQHRYTGWGACTGGGWSGWSSWSGCSASCGYGTQTRTRSCNTSGTMARSYFGCMRIDQAGRDVGYVNSASCSGAVVTTSWCAFSCSGSSSESQSCYAGACYSSGWGGGYSGGDSFGGSGDGNGLDYTPDGQGGWDYTPGRGTNDAWDTYYSSPVDNGSGSSGSGKIVCTAMNHAYGFGSFRNKIWLVHSQKHLTKYHEVGYHAIFLPLVNYGFYGGDGVANKLVRGSLEHIARHRTTDIWKQRRGDIDYLGRVYRTVLEPTCYAVGWVASRNKSMLQKITAEVERLDKIGKNRNRKTSVVRDQNGAQAT